MKPGSLNNTDEALLAEQCKRNNAAAQKVMYSRYADDMMLLCLRYIDRKEDAKEVLMDGFLAFFNSMKGFTYRGAGSVKAWLKKIMVNQCLQYLRKRNPFRNVVDVGTTNLASPEIGLDWLSAKEIIAMIHTLPDGYRTIFNLYVFEEMSHLEIAALLGITESTSKSQLHRARALLKEKIVQYS